jgi:hypothetical protein
MSKWRLLVAVGCLTLTPTVFGQEAAAAPKKAPTAKSAMDAAMKELAKPVTKPVTKPATKSARPDRLDLETTVVTGNRELPKVLYIVPWKKADLGELPAQPFNSLLDEVLQPVDREVFKREVKYFQAISAGVGSGAPGVKPGSAPTPLVPQ